MECTEPFELLTPHNCKIVEKKRQEKENLLEKYNHELNAKLYEEESV